MLNEIETLKQAIEEADNVTANVETQLNNQLSVLQKRRIELNEKLKNILSMDQTSQIDLEALPEFLEEPYVLIPRGGQEWYVLVPRWLKLQVGYLDHQTPSYNVFIVNKYVKWLSEIPRELESKLKFAESLPFKVSNNRLVTGGDLQEKGWQKYRDYLSVRDGQDKIKIRPGYEFKLIARLVEDGILPFEAKQVSQEDLRDWNDAGHSKYLEVCDSKNIKGIQDRAWGEFLKYGAIGCYWSFGSGKSLFGHRGIGCIKGPKLVVVPSIILREQWIERIAAFNPTAKDEVTVITYHGYEKVCKQEWSLVIFDEHQHLPATSFMKLSTIKTKYRLGFSGSPFREDGRESYIFALTGYPVGMSWTELLQLHVMNVPQFRIYILPDKKSKDRKLNELMRLPLKTIIFCDSLDYGEEISKQLNIPFIYGSTNDRLETIRNSPACIVSRVGDEGLSDLKLQRIIEVAFLFGSRMQESQRFGRLMHSKESKTQHIILMTRVEFETYQKRLLAITERGFKLELIQDAS
jgi:DNA excision repair protein ERCC-3